MRARLLILIVAVLFLVCACHPPAPTRKSTQDPAAVRQKIGQQLDAGNYTAALALAQGSGLSEAEVAEEHGRALKGLLEQAEAYLEKGLPEKAGPLYRTALDGYPKTPATAAKVGTAPPGVAARIKTCADQLLERGLSAYRNGDLEQAIRTWKLIHVFAPRHQASLKALQTAEVQLANLKKVQAEK